MKIDISSIKGLDKSELDFEGEVLLENTEFNDAKLKSPINVKGKVKNLGGRFSINSILFADFEQVCARCLKDFCKSYEFLMEETLNDEDNADYLKLNNNIIDITDAVYTNLVINMTGKYLCSDECKGLCSGCGANLNDEECHCI